MTEPPASGTRSVCRVVLAEGNSLILSELERLLSLSKDFEVVATCSTGRAAITAILQNAPHIAVINVDLPEGKRYAEALCGEA